MRGYFEKEVYANGILYVPAGSLELYKNAPDWKKFVNIKEIGSSGIEWIDSEFMPEDDD